MVPIEVRVVRVDEEIVSYLMVFIGRLCHLLIIIAEAVPTKLVRLLIDIVGHLAIQYPSFLLHVILLPLVIECKLGLHEFFIALDNLHQVKLITHLDSVLRLRPSFFFHLRMGWERNSTTSNVLGKLSSARL